MSEADSPFLATMKRTFERPSALPWLFGATAALLVLSLVVIFFSGQITLRTAAALIEQQSTIDALEDTLSTLKDAETGQRGYLLMGDDKYLTPYQIALSHIKEDLAGLDAKAAAGELSAADVSQIKQFISDKLAELEQTVQLKRAGDTAGAMAIVRGDTGRMLMESARQAIARIVLQNQNHLVELRLDSGRANTIRTASFVATALVNLLFLAWSFNRLQREMGARRDAAEEAARQRELVAVTLASIGDAVIVTDAAGLVLFLNDIAVKLTGWPLDEARGQPCERVFNIVNEATRKTVEGPVDKVLRSGIIVGLANHTVLLHRDGSETPIDDSGAPIRGEDGKVRGVVLVFRDFSEHKNVERQLLIAKQEAEAANIAKDNFLATLSHELRTPLTPVLAILSAWEQRGNCPPEFVPDLQTMRRSVELEARLIDDLLDLTRIVRGKLQLNIEVTDVHELIDAVADMNKSELFGKKITLSLKLNAPKFHVSADSGRLQQVLWNLLKNATKFTGEGGRISIETANEDGQIIIYVRDDGIGISAETLARLFRPFEQGSEESIRRYGGLGLGLAISKALVVAQGGHILAASEGLGKGAAFSIQFAITEPHARVQKSGMPALTGERRKLRILLVEDHADTARVIGYLLREMGHEVTMAENVQSSLEILKTATFDLLLSDIGLPDGTGIDLIEGMKAQGHAPLNAIAMTGFGMEEDVTRSLEAGFKEHLTKPINFQQLDSVIQRVAKGEVAVEGQRSA